MPDYPGLLKNIKQAAVEAVEASKPANCVFGTVISEEPLQIKIDQKMTLAERQLILTRNVTDYELTMTVDHLTEPAGGGDGKHVHEYIGEKIFAVHNSLLAGEKVVLLQEKGGQKYIVLDRVIG